MQESTTDHTEVSGRNRGPKKYFTISKYVILSKDAWKYGLFAYLSMVSRLVGGV